MHRLGNQAAGRGVFDEDEAPLGAGKISKSDLKIRSRTSPRTNVPPSSSPIRRSVAQLGFGFDQGGETVALLGQVDRCVDRRLLVAIIDFEPRCC